MHSVGFARIRFNLSYIIVRPYSSSTIIRTLRWPTQHNGCFGFLCKNKSSDAASIKTDTTLVEAAFDSEKGRKLDAAAAAPFTSLT